MREFVNDVDKLFILAVEEGTFASIKKKFQTFHDGYLLSFHSLLRSSHIIQTVKYNFL